MELSVFYADYSGDDHSGAVRLLLQKALGYRPRIEAGEHGKPYLPQAPHVHISLSHTKGAVVCAVCDQPVGVDVELVSRPISPKFAARYFSACEQQTYRPEDWIAVWTRKEAALKRDGLGVTAPLCTLDTAKRGDICTKRYGAYVISVCAADGIGDFHITEQML